MGNSVIVGPSQGVSQRSPHMLARRVCTAVTCGFAALSLCAALLPAAAFADQGGSPADQTAVEPTAVKCQPWLMWLCRIMGVGSAPGTEA